jgi:hypothetical protein
VRAFASILALILGFTLSAAPPASSAVAAPTESRASGSASALTTLVGIEARLSEEAVRENAALGYDVASDDAVAARGINVTERGLAHVLERHVAGGARTAGKSLFGAGEDAAALVRGASGVQRVQQAGGNFERVIDAGRTIGVDRATGQPTSIYTVITNAADELITAFPGRP